MLTRLMAAAALAAAPIPAADQPVQIGQGAQALHASLLRPAGPAAPAAILFINGSGPGDRDGNDIKDGERSQTTRLLALAMAERGIVSLRYDKRGNGESAGAGEAATFDQAVDEAAGWARLLARQPGVRCVVVVGHSEGAEIGAVVARKVPLCGLVEVSGASRDLGAVIEQQAVLLRRPPEIRQQIQAAVEAMRAGRAVEKVPEGYDSLFAGSGGSYTRSKINLDPTAELAAVRVSVLVVQGDNDLQSSVDDARRLAAAAKVEPVIIPGATHVLKVAPKDVQANIRTYMDPDLPLAPGVAQAIGDFVLARR